MSIRTVKCRLCDNVIYENGKAKLKIAVIHHLLNTHGKEYGVYHDAYINMKRNQAEEYNKLIKVAETLIDYPEVIMPNHEGE